MSPKQNVSIMIRCYFYSTLEKMTMSQTEPKRCALGNDLNRKSAYRESNRVDMTDSDRLFIVDMLHVAALELAGISGQPTLGPADKARFVRDMKRAERLALRLECGQ